MPKSPRESSLGELVKALDNLDISKLTVGDLQKVSNPVLADALRKIIEAGMLQPGGPAHHGHTSHLNHLSHYASLATEGIDPLATRGAAKGRRGGTS